MKYIIYIFFIASIATLSFFYSLDSPSAEKNYAALVDGRTISSKEVDLLKLQSPALFSHSEELPQSLIVREVLIAEALRQKVDKEEGFRHRIKTFYEQSLVKILVERKMDSIQYTPSDKELAAYTNLQGRIIDIDLIPLNSQAQPSSIDSEQLSGSFMDFSLAIRMAILFININTSSDSIELFDQFYIVTVKKIGEKDPIYTKYDKDRDFAAIQEYRQQELFRLWQESLVQKADIVLAPKPVEDAS